MLTQKQRQLLIFIHERMSTGQIAPSFEEMKIALNLKSKSGIHRLINGLVERGHLERLPHRARALEVRRLPDGYNPDRGDQSLVAEKLRATRHALENVTDRIIRSIPLYGKIAAGTPIEAIADEGETIAVPGEILGAGRHYALSVEGDSMIESGIRDGDIVIIRQTDQAPDGTIVVALVDDQEVTLKTIKRDAGMIHLIPANSQYTPLILPAGNVKIQGVLAGLYRTY